MQVNHILRDKPSLIILKQDDETKRKHDTEL